MFTCAKYAYEACLCWVCILWRNVCGSCLLFFLQFLLRVFDACQDAAAVDASRQPVLFSSALCSRAPNTRMKLVCAGFVSCGVMFMAPGMLFFLQFLLRVFDACQDAAAVDASRQPVLFSSALCSRAPNTCMQLVCAGFLPCGVMFVAPGMLFFFQSLLPCVSDACQDAAAVDASRQPVLFSSALCSRAPNTRMQLVCAGFVSCGVMCVAPSLLFFLQLLLRVFDACQDAFLVDVVFTCTIHAYAACLSWVCLVV